jgi:hypothetical protein
VSESTSCQVRVTTDPLVLQAEAALRRLQALCPSLFVVLGNAASDLLGLSPITVPEGQSVPVHFKQDETIDTLTLAREKASALDEWTRHRDNARKLKDELAATRKVMAHHLNRTREFQALRQECHDYPTVQHMESQAQHHNDASLQANKRACHLQKELVQCRVAEHTAWQKCRDLGIDTLPSPGNPEATP